MRSGILFFCAIACMVAGHVFKVYRWGKSFLAVYEEPPMGTLLNAMAIGQTVNAVLPVRAGDLFRAFWAGRKLKNGYAFSIASVITDLYLDLATVSAMFLILSIIGKGGRQMQVMAQGYLLLIFLIIPVTVLCIMFRKFIKKMIRIVASVFNQKIEFEILLVSYLTISSVKDIAVSIHKKKLFIYTAGMWLGYTASYVFFAEVLQNCGHFYTASEVFMALFSGMGLKSMERSVQGIWTAYLLLPLAVCIVISVLIRNTVNQELGYKKTLPQMNQSDRLSFLRTYYAEEKRDYIQSYLDINRDVTVMEDHSAGSNASTVIVMKNDGNIYFRKYAFYEDGIKLREQMEWIERHQMVLPLPIITQSRYEGNFVTYDMHSYRGAEGMFQMIHSMPPEQNWKILNHVLNDIRTGLHSMNRRRADREKMEQYIDSKVCKNLQMIRKSDKFIKALEQYDVLWINGRKLHTLRHYLKMLEKEHLIDVFKEDAYADIHGDLTVENIVCVCDPMEINQQEYKNKRKPIDYYLIDPNTGNVHDSPFLDFAKLLQSLHGNYEFLMMVSSVKIRKDCVEYMMVKSEAYAQIYNKYRDYLREQFSFQEVLSIYYHEIIHWLRLMPYKIQKDEKLAVVFYTGLLAVLNDVKEMEEDGQKKTGSI